MDDVSGVVIVGAGQAGAAAAVALRSEGFDGSVTVVGAEPHPPYERPPLSKTYLRGETAREDAQLQDAQFWTAQGVDLLTSTPVQRIDAAGRRIELADGSVFGYDRLVLATGSAARSLAVPGADLDGVLTLRTVEDADRVRSRAREAEHVLVVGGGWIGSEITASLRQMGVPVTWAFPGDLPLATVLGTTIAGVYDRLHREHGAVVLPRTRIVALEGDRQVRAARTASGEQIPADLVVVAVGAAPKVELALGAGLDVADGVIVDGSLRTTDPRILAVGDVARAPYPDLGRSLRVEHWGTAQSQGAHAARTILGERATYSELPYFFSDQYDTGMEFWGDPALPGELVVRGDLAARSFTAFWHQEGQVRAALNMHVHHHEHMHGQNADERELDGHLDVQEHVESTGQHRHDDGPAGGREVAVTTAHAGGHVDTEVVTRLVRFPSPVSVDALRDPDVPLEQLAGDRT